MAGCGCGLKKRKKAKRGRGLGDPHTGCPVRRIAVGPVGVSDMAALLRRVPGVYNVVAGTEHVHFDFPGDTADLLKATKTLRNLLLYKRVRAYTRGMWWDACR